MVVLHPHAPHVEEMVVTTGEKVSGETGLEQIKEFIDVLFWENKFNSNKTNTTAKEQLQQIIGKAPSSQGFVDKTKSYVLSACSKVSGLLNSNSLTNSKSSDNPSKQLASMDTQD